MHTCGGILRPLPPPGHTQSHCGGKRGAPYAHVWGNIEEGVEEGSLPASPTV